MRVYYYTFNNLPGVRNNTDHIIFFIVFVFIYLTVNINNRAVLARIKPKPELLVQFGKF